MIRRLPTLWFLLAGCSGAAPTQDHLDSEPPSGVPLDAGTSKPDLDASPLDAIDGDSGVPIADSGRATDDDAGAVEPDAEAGDIGPVSCDPLVAAGLDLCTMTAETCEVVFTNNEGCAAACALGGLSCLASYEDGVGCAADPSRPALGCASTGHASDYCVCGRAGATPPPPPLPDPCDLLAERAGFGRDATGGDPNLIYRVDTLSGGTSGTGDSGSLRRALESATDWWIVFDVDGVITFQDEIQVESNKTIDGRGRDVTLDGTLRIDEAHDVIITDIRLKNDLTPACGQSGDVIVLSGPGGADPADFPTNDIWLHHLEIFEGGDGLLDLRGATNVTVSWTHFHTHKKGLLMWRDSNQQDVPGMQVTMHHNYFDRISLRGPQFLYGKLHFVNNYQFEWFYYGAGCLGEGQCASENNVFQARASCVVCTDTNPCGDQEWFPDFTKAFVKEWADNGIGYIRSTGDLLLGGATIDVNQPNQVFDPAASYSFTAEAATQSLADQIRAEAGPRTSLSCPR